MTKSDKEATVVSADCLLLKVNSARVTFSTSWALVACHTLGFHTKASEPEGSNQRQEDSISYKKFLQGKIIIYMEMIGILPRYNTSIISRYQCQVPY